jgi:hypothetical protein
VADQPRGARDRERSLGDQVGEVAAVGVAHHQVGDALVFADIVDRQDIAVFEAGDRARFALEAGAEVRVARQVLRQHLDRHVAIHGGVIGFVDRRHPPQANLFEDAIGAEVVPN